jgi:hypothetical protein
MKRTTLVRILAFSVVVGVVVGACALYAGVRHNPQCEFSCADGVSDSLDVAYSALVFLSWFVPTSVLIFLLALALSLLSKILTRWTARS